MLATSENKMRGLQSTRLDVAPSPNDSEFQIEWFYCLGETETMKSGHQGFLNRPIVRMQWKTHGFRALARGADAALNPCRERWPQT
jgi:hypothetical protein